MDESLAFVNITSRHTPVQSITVAPMQLTALKQPSSTTTDPVLTRLEKNGFSNSRPPSATVQSKRNSVREIHFFLIDIDIFSRMRKI